MTIKRTLETFRAAHDPMFGIKDPRTVYARERPDGFRVAIITAAQNATPVHAEFWACLLTAAKHRKAELFVIPTRYKNPTSHWSGSQRNAEYYDPAVVPHLHNQRLELNANLMLLADFPIQPTASSPLTGNEGVGHGKSCIIGHAKLQFKTVATPGNMLPKIMTTTGICTVPNYTASRAGKMGEFHHSLSAAIVELDGDKVFHVRQLHYSSRVNAVTDGARGIMYLPNGKIKKAPRARVVNQGDTHVDFVDPAVDAATWGPGGLIETVNPEFAVWADLLDANSITHHEEKDQFLRGAKEAAGRRCIKSETERAVDHVRQRRLRYPNIKHVIQAANHDDMLRRAVVDCMNNGFRDPHNASFFLKLAHWMDENKGFDEAGAFYPDPFKWLVDSAQLPDVRVLEGDESFAPGDIENGMHGHMGPNGARGSRKNLARIGVKSNINHSHSSGIEEGCYQAGTSTRVGAKRARYARGPSSWLQTHILQQHDDKRQLLNFIDGEYLGK